MQLQQLQRRERKALAEGRRGRLDRLAEELVAALEFAGHRAGQVRIGNGVDADGVEPAPIEGRFELVHGMHHAHVAGHLQHGRQIHHAIAPAVVVENRPAANGHRAGVIHLGVGINDILLEG